MASRRHLDAILIIRYEADQHWVLLIPEFSIALITDLLHIVCFYQFNHESLISAHGFNEIDAGVKYIVFEHIGVNDLALNIDQFVFNTVGCQLNKF